MNVLSLFDGISCGQLALSRAGISVDNYFASEIDKKAISVTQTRYPKTIQLGDVVGVSIDKLPKIDLLIGGSPCQGFSSSGKKLNFNDPRSKLFFEFVRILNACKPEYFMLENVVMCKTYKDTITSYLGVNPVLINSALVSAQCRKRLYWANFAITPPTDRNIKLSDIIDGGFDVNYPLNKWTITGRRLSTDGTRRDYDKSIPTVQCLEVRGINSDKSNCLTTVMKDNVLTPLPVGRYADPFGKKLPFRYYTLKECCRLQTIPDDYFDGIVSDSKAKHCLGNGWTADVIAHILRQIPV